MIEHQVVPHTLKELELGALAGRQVALRLGVKSESSLPATTSVGTVAGAGFAIAIRSMSTKARYDSSWACFWSRSNSARGIGLEKKVAKAPGVRPSA